MKLRFWNSPDNSTSVFAFIAKPKPAPTPQMLRSPLPLPSVVPPATSFEMNERLTRRPRLPLPILWPHRTSNASPVTLGSLNPADVVTGSPNSG